MAHKLMLYGIKERLKVYAGIVLLYLLYAVVSTVSKPTPRMDSILDWFTWSYEVFGVKIYAMTFVLLGMAAAALLVAEIIIFVRDFYSPQASPARTTPYQYAYHLLADPQTVNASALPGGQVFITRALYDQLQTDGELASILGHETGHVVARHSAEQIAKAQLTEGLTGAAVIAACNPNNPNGCVAASQMVAIVGQLISMKYSRADETEADWLGVCFMNDKGYNSQDMVKVMQLLDSLSQGQRPPEFLSTHPDPGNRIPQIQADILNMDQCP